VRSSARVESEVSRSERAEVSSGEGPLGVLLVLGVARERERIRR
jgi:hypothetical protein